jgi:sulfoxide reductase catalytic subunit YedY
MLIKRPSDIKSSQITPERLYLNRRAFIEQATAIGAVAAVSAATPAVFRRNVAQAVEPMRAGQDEEKLTSYEDATSYNNFYEFGTGKDDPAKNAKSFQTRPWKVAVEGEIAKPGEYDLDDLLRGITTEERIYRLRCVEAWSMVIPWMGFPLSTLINRFEPTSDAKYVELTTLHDPEQMPGQRRNILPWPYVEGLRMDEAMHPLTILATGLYGRELPNQNGAPLRLVVPWKYGFKSVKSIVRIRFVQDQPRNTWNVSIPHEYGFYANVNPEVDHPRWSQARERRIGDFFKRPTLMFNGYADQVAHLYEGMDLERYY